MLINGLYLDSCLVKEKSKLTAALFELLSLSTESRMLLLVLETAFGCTLDLGRGTGFTFTSEWFPSVTAL